MNYQAHMNAQEGDKVSNASVIHDPPLSQPQGSMTLAQRYRLEAEMDVAALESVTEMTTKQEYQFYVTGALSAKGMNQYSELLGGVILDSVSAHN